MYKFDIIESWNDCGFNHIGCFPFDHEIEDSSKGKQTLDDIAKQMKELDSHYTYTASTCESQKLIGPILRANGFRVVGITEGAHSPKDTMTYWLRLRKSKKNKYKSPELKRELERLAGRGK